MNTVGGFSPLRNLRDIEDLERVPLEQRLLSWDANDWIRRGLDLAPQKWRSDTWRTAIRTARPAM